MFVEQEMLIGIDFNDVIDAFKHCLPGNRRLLLFVYNLYFFMYFL